MSALSTGLDVAQEHERVGGARVGREPLIVQVKGTIGKHHGILDDGTVFEVVRRVEDGAKDLWLFIGAQVDQLGIAAVFIVGDPTVAPAMLVVTQQRTAGVSRQSGLSCAREPQKQRAVPVCALVCRAMQRKNARQG